MLHGCLTARSAAACSELAPLLVLPVPTPTALAPTALAAALLLSTTGCATRGPLHVYSLSTGAERPVLDFGAGGSAEVPSFLAEEDRVTGFAYDPYTDHFFLRLAPGNRIRVVDRPARAIKRELEIKGAPEGSGDMAVRPVDGHIYLLGPEPGRLLRCTRLGKFLGDLTLEGAAADATGLAFDMGRDVLLVLGEGGRRVTVHDLSGRRASTMATPARASATKSVVKRPSIGSHSAARPTASGSGSEASGAEKSGCSRSTATS